MRLGTVTLRPWIQFHLSLGLFLLGVSAPMLAAEPGSTKGLHVVVEDIEAAHADLTAKGVPVSEPFHFGSDGMTPGPDPARRSRGTRR